MAEQESLRERKKRKTREALIAASRALFLEKGYEATTLQDICDQVEVTPPTLLNYFDSKEKLALAVEYDELAELQKVLDQAIADGQPVLDTFIDFMTGSLGTISSNPKVLSAYIDMVRESPTLSRAYYVLSIDRGTALAQALSQEAGQNDVSADLYARSLSATIMGLMGQALDTCYSQGTIDDLKRLSLNLIKGVMDRFPERDDFEELISA